MSRPLLSLIVRRELAGDFVRAGERPLEALRHARQATNELVEEATAEAEATTGILVPDAPAPVVTGTVGAIFDGHRLKELEAWLQTDTGKMFLQILKAILMALLPLILTPAPESP